MTVRVAVVLLTRDLRVHDHPALAEACRYAERVVPLFVRDAGLVRAGFATPNRSAFLHDALADLRESLRDRGGDLVLRDGDPADRAVALARSCGADRIYVSADVTAFACRREARLRRAAAAHGVEVVATPGVTVVPIGRLTATGGGAYRLFTPFWRAWAATAWRAVVAPPTRIHLPDNLDPGELAPVDRSDCSPRLAAGGETIGHRVLRAWARDHLAAYEENHDDLAADRTSRISPYLHLGCLSPLEVATRLAPRPGGEAYVRQLAWRDFHHETIARFPALPGRDLHPRGRHWHDAPDLLEAWQEGRTGVPLVDGDIANNSANWQWVAGTGTDTRPNRVLNPVRQAARHDPVGEYVDRYVARPPTT